MISEHVSDLALTKCGNFEDQVGKFPRFDKMLIGYYYDSSTRVIQVQRATVK